MCIGRMPHISVEAWSNAVEPPEEVWYDAVEAPGEGAEVSGGNVWHL